MNNIFIVMATKFGDISKHTYFVNCFDKKQKAINYANIEFENRGGKYEVYVLEVNTDYQKEVYKKKSNE